MNHKAFEFRWSAFELELLPTLLTALEQEQIAPVVEFVESNLARCTDPYQGEALDSTWKDSLESHDVHEVGDFALTRYYDILDDHGLGASWTDLSDSLSSAEADALLGCPIGFEDFYFDPGRMGSYFQNPRQASKSLSLLRRLQLEPLSRFCQLLQRSVKNQTGIYVTF